jgi:phosphoadenosine phosphosulfate reductase
MQDLNKLNEQFETATPQEIMRWAMQTYGQKAALSSSFGAQSVVLLHMLVEIDPTIPVLFLDTGHLFQETHQFKNQLQQRLKFNLKEFKATPQEVAQVNARLANNSVEKGTCCDDVKVRLMQESLQGVECWMAGLRRGQADTRKNIKIIEQYGTGLIKVHPIANWSGKDTYDYMKKFDLPFHPLWEKCYKSIGCEPCTTLPLPGQDERSGRWAGQDKTECGIHTFMAKPKEIKP